MRTTRSQKVVIVDHLKRDKWDYVENDLSDWRWIYFGKDVQRFFSIRQGLANKGQMLNAGELINQVADEIRADFIDFDKHLVFEGDPLLWQTMDLAARNPYTSDFFYRCCALIALDRILRTLDTDLLVFVEDWFFGNLMAKRAHRAGFTIKYIGTHLGWGDYLDGAIYVWYCLRYLMRAVKCRIEFIHDWFKTNRLLDRHGLTNKLDKYDSAKRLSVLLVTWADPATFRAEGFIERDVYFGSLPKFLRDREIEVVYLANPASWVYPLDQIVNNLSSARDRVILPEKCLRFGDVIRVALQTMQKPWAQTSTLDIGGLDLKELLEDEGRRERGTEGG